MQNLRRHSQIVLFLFCLLPWDYTWSVSVLPSKYDQDGGHRADDPSDVSYGTEVSWPMQHAFSTIDSISAPQRQNYITFMEGCALAYGHDLCEASEHNRLALNAQQPQWQRNFTATGYAKVRAPTQLFQILEDFWYAHYDSDDDNDSDNHNLLVDEEWPKGNIYTNQWKAPTKLLLVDSPDPKRPKLNVRIRRQLFQEVQTIVQDWIGGGGGGVPLVATAMYGIRAYTRGSIVTPHVERHPLVLTALIHVAQEGLEQDWPLELVNHDGRAVNVTLKPGEMLLYESHSILHGRPYPLQGDVYANLFLHFEPIGFTAEAEQRRPQQEAKTSAKNHFLSALQRSQQNVETGDPLIESSPKKNNPLASSSSTTTTTTQRSNRELPHYIREGTVEADRWRQNFVFQRRDLETEHVELERNRAARRREQRKVWTANRLAMEGDLEQLRELAEKDPSAVNQRDQNGWKPIHEAARSGEVEVIKYLIDEHDVDINERTNGGYGGTPLFWAEHALHPNHEAIALLRRRGAVAIPPELT